MRFFSGDTTFDFLGKRRITMVISGLLLLISIGSLAVQQLNFGIDFTGGTVIEVGYEAPADLEATRAALNAAGFDQAVVQHFGTTRDVLIRLAPRAELKASELSEQVLNAVREIGPGMTMRRIEFVGPQVGEELTEQGGLAMLAALGLILAYVAFRFELRFAVGSVIALVHDVMITLGAFSLMQWDFDLTVLAALLAVIGYSLNDTIVVFDRIRERFREQIKGSAEEIMNLSINQTLSRTVMTSVTTLLVLTALLILGGEVIRGFSLALIVGVVIGTYSSIFVASVAALLMGVNKEKFAPVEREGADFGAMV